MDRRRFSLLLMKRAAALLVVVRVPCTLRCACCAGAFEDEKEKWRRRSRHTTQLEGTTSTGVWIDLGRIQKLCASDETATVLARCRRGCVGRTSLVDHGSPIAVVMFLRGMLRHFQRGFRSDELCWLPPEDATVITRSVSTREHVTITRLFQTEASISCSHSNRDARRAMVFFDFDAKHSI